MTLPPLKWVPSPNFYNRPLNPLRIVLHDTEGGYEGAISWFSNRHSDVSAHLVLKEDGSEVTQMVAFDRVAWHVYEDNAWCLGLECAGFMKKGLGEPEWQAAADIVAYLANRFGIPLLWAKTGEQKGLCQHRDLGEPGGSHYDITADPNIWAHFLDLAAKAQAGGGFPPQPWGR